MSCMTYFEDNEWNIESLRKLLHQNLSLIRWEWARIRHSRISFVLPQFIYKTLNFKSVTLIRSGPLSIWLAQWKPKPSNYYRTKRNLFGLVPAWNLFGFQNYGKNQIELVDAQPYLKYSKYFYTPTLAEQAQLIQR